jgi:ABC-type phosphate/phosphonate transport system substrate-binding protein
MRRTRLGSGLSALVLVLVLLVPFLASTPGQAANHQRGSLRIGLVGSLFRNTPEALIQIMMGPFKSLMVSQTGLRGEIVSGGEYDALAEKLKEGKVDLGVFHGVEFAWARMKHPELEPVFICVNHHHSLRAFLVVRSDGKVTKPALLAGKRVGLPATSKEHCRLFLSRRCVRPGTTPEKFFSALNNPFDTEEALDNLIYRLSDAAIVDAVEWEHYQKIKPGVARRLRVLLESEPLPCGVVAYHAGQLPKEQVKRFRDGMIRARSTRKGRQLLRLSRLTSIEPVPADYDAQLAAALKAYPPPPPKTATTEDKEKGEEKKKAAE